MQLPSLSIIIVNYNTADLLKPCLDSLCDQAEHFISIIVVDNNSEDNSVELVRTHYPQVKLIANADNLGFSAANNQALNLCETDLVFFLNPDTVLHRDCLARIRDYMAKNVNVGLAGVEIMNQQGMLHDSVEYSYPGSNYAKEILGELPGQIAWVLGAGMVGRMQLMEELLGFDERFFLYAEDIDLCLRVRQAGWEIGLIGGARVMHVEGQSERGVDCYRIMEKKTRAELSFFRKHYPEEVTRKLFRARKLQAVWRIFCLTCFPALSADKRQVNQDKLAKYKAVSKVYGEARV